MALNKYNTSALADKGRPLVILNPATQVSLGVRFFLLGIDSKEYKRITQQQQSALRDKQKRCRGVYMATPEETEKNNLDLLVGLTTGWEEDVTNEEGEVTGVRPDIELDEGEFVPFTPEAARRIYASLGFNFIREQVDQFIGDRRDFLPNAN